MIKKVDLRGLLCPEPVIKVKKLFDDPLVGRVEASVDDLVCVSNLERLSRSLKAGIQHEAKAGFYQVVIERKAPDKIAAEGGGQAAMNGKNQACVIFLGKDSFGAGDPELSRSLLDLFLQTALDSGQEPKAILLANSGVKLMSPDSAASNVLAAFIEKGCEVLACGLCLEFYGLKDQVPAERVTNMFAISEYLFSADKVLTF